METLGAILRNDLRGVTQVLEHLARAGIAVARVALDRVKPVSTIANPSCMNITRKPAISSHARFSELSSGGDEAAVCARATDEKIISAASVAAASPSCDRLGIISSALDMTGAAETALPGNGLRARSKEKRPR